VDINKQHALETKDHCRKLTHAMTPPPTPFHNKNVLFQVFKPWGTHSPPLNTHTKNGQMQVLETLRRVEAEKVEEAEQAYLEEQGVLTRAKAELLQALAKLKSSGGVIRGTTDKVPLHGHLIPLIGSCGKPSREGGVTRAKAELLQALALLNHIGGVIRGAADKIQLHGHLIP